MNINASASGVAIFLAKGVLEDAFDVVCGLLIGVDGKIALNAKAERAQIVKAHDVVCVAMGVQDGVDVANAFAQCLRVKVRTCINQYDAAVVGETDRWARAPVVWIGRGADGAVAAERRY